MHFISDCFITPLRNRLLNYTPKNLMHLRYDVPTINIPKSVIEDKATLERFKIIKRKTQTELVDNMLLNEREKSDSIKNLYKMLVKI